mgnify:CR=1 FL=1
MLSRNVRDLVTFFAETSSSAVSSYRKVLYNSVAECFLALELRGRSEGFRDRQTKSKEKRTILSSLAQGHADSFDDGKIFFLLTQSSWWYN